MKKWELQNDLVNYDKELINKEIINILLRNRGIKTKKEIENFLNPQLENLDAETLGINRVELLKTKKRIVKAIKEREKIIVYGDYDVDGITGTAILWEVLNSEGADVMPYVPHRIDEGYGLSKKGIDNLIEKYKDLKLIITVDNGIVAFDAVDYANSLGIDVIITDHHVMGEKIPNAYSVIHSLNVCGSSVSYFLSKEIGNVTKEHLALAALATVADVMKLTGFNRDILFHGLNAIRNTKRIGLVELINVCQIEKEKIGVYEIGHMIAPRINASGRLENGMDSLRLLCTKNKVKARELALNLNRINQERQRITVESFEFAKSEIKKQKLKNIIFIGDQKFPPGVIGLISGRLTEEFYRPSIVLSIGEKFSKASSRSILGFNIIEFIRENSEYLVDAGGHPMAAGFTIETSRIGSFKKNVLKLSEKINMDLFDRKIKVDIEISFEQITMEFYEKINSLSPFGYGNPEPIFLTKNLQIRNLKKVGKEGKHLKLELEDVNKEKRIMGILFGYDESLDLKNGDKIDVVYSLSLNEWNGTKKLEIKIRDIKKN